MFKKILIGIIGLTILCGIFGTDENVSNKDESNTIESTTETKETNYIEVINTANFTTSKELSKFFFENLNDIATGEQLYDLGEVDFDTIVEKAENAQRLMETTDHGNTKVDVISKLIIVDDLVYHTTNQAFGETGAYLINEFKNGNLFTGGELGKKLYMANLLVEICNEEEDNSEMAQIFFDMFQGLKDMVRIQSNTFDEEIESSLEHSMNANIDQINKNLAKISK